MASSRFAFFTEGSLLKRTLVSVGTFVAGSALFLGVLSLVLVSIARGVLPSHDDEPADGKTEAAASTATAKSPLVKPKGKRKGGAAIEQPATATTAAEDGE